jgi:hypothetical protein
MDIFLATGPITQESLFLNGLHQNSLTLYTLFERLGYRCHCLTDVSEAFLEGYRSLEPETYLQNPEPYRLALYIEIGHAFDAAWRSLLQRRGVRVIKLLLGNVRNIDLEMTHHMNVSFYHHVIGNYDEIWTSPHYRRNCAYAAALYSTPCRTVPYVWSPAWIQRLHRYVRRPWTVTDLVVAEPNISFQKHCLYPLLLVEAFASRVPEWTGRLILQNTERFQVNGLLQQRVAASPLKDRIVLRNRQPLAEILRDNPSAAFVCHQVTNEYNYMTLELLYLGYPVLHNSKPWATHGYAWDEEDWSASLRTLQQMLVEGPRVADLSAFYPDKNREAWSDVLSIRGRP